MICLSIITQQNKQRKRDRVSNSAFSLTHKFPLFFRLSIFSPKRKGGTVSRIDNRPFRTSVTRVPLLAIHEDGPLTIRLSYVFLHVSLPVNDIENWLIHFPVKSYPYCTRPLERIFPLKSWNSLYIGSIIFVEWKGKLVVSNLETVKRRGRARDFSRIQPLGSNGITGPTNVASSSVSDLLSSPYPTPLLNYTRFHEEKVHSMQGSEHESFINHVC